VTTKRSRRFRIAAILVGVLFTFGLLEATWRIYLFHFAPPERFVKWARARDIPPEWRRYAPHPYLAYAANPGYRGRNGKTRLNSLGFRAPEFTKKPPGTYRILFVGGSTTYTGTAQNAHTYPARVGQRLAGHYGHEQVEAINAGVIGYSSLQTLINLRLRLLDACEPDLVVVLHAINDMYPRMVPPALYRRDETGYRDAWHDLPEHWWEASLLLRYLGFQWGLLDRRVLLDRVGRGWPVTDGDHAAATLAQNPPIFAKRNFEEIVRLVRSRGAQVMFSTMASSPAIGDFVAHPAYQRGFDEHNRLTKQVGREMQAPVFDWAAVMPGDTKYWNDGQHVNEAGARLKAEQFAGFIHERFLKGR